MTPLEQQLRAAGYQGSFELGALVRACGDKFYNLKKSFGGKRWDAASLPPVTVADQQTITLGRTPEEAVQSLLLSLLQDKSA